MKSTEQDGYTLVNREVHAEATATSLDQPASGMPKREGNRTVCTSETKTGSQSELVYRNRHDAAAVIRNEQLNQVDTQHQQREISRETHRSQLVSQTDQQHASELVQRNNAENRTTQWQENNSRTVSETVNRTNTEGQATVRQEHQNRHQQITETTSRNTTEQIHRRQSETEKVDKLVSENRNISRKENTFRQVNTLQENHTTEHVNLVQRQNISSFEERISEQRIHNQLYSQVSHYREISLGHGAEILMPASLPFHKPGIIQLPIQKTSPDPSWLVFLYRQFDFAFLLGYNPSRFPKGVGIPSIVLLFFSCQ